MSFLFAYAHAQRVGAEFQCPPWIGEEVFNLPKYGRPDGRELPVRSELDLKPDETDVCIRGYSQNHQACIYTKRQAQEWLHLKHLIKYTIDADYWNDRIVAHYRRGDFQGYSYPLLSAKSYHDACISHGLAKWTEYGTLEPKFIFVSEENPTPFPDGIVYEGMPSFIPDFHRMVCAPVLLRANSSFSWVAGLLNNGRVFSPLVKGLKGGEEHHITFVEGNHCALSDLACGSDMHLPE